MKNVFDEIASKFGRDIDVAIAGRAYLRGDLFLERVRSAIPAGGYLLDYGCGPGRMGVLLARSGYRVLGVDTAPEMIAQACALDRSGLDIEFDVADGATDAFQSATYDGIVCSSVIEYVADPRELLRRLHRALRRDGVLFISYANKSSVWRWYVSRSSARNPMAGSHHHTYHWRGFRALLAESGFRPIGGPRFFESPYDWRPFGAMLGKAPLVGMLGIVVARRDAG